MTVPVMTRCHHCAEAGTARPIARGSCWCAALWLYLLLAVIAMANASPAAMEAGHEALRTGRYHAALEYFLHAEQDDRPRAMFFQAVAHNRLGRFAEATRLLIDAREAGFEHGEMDFELGWALLRLGFHAEAVEHLEAYEAARPGRGQTSEFLGRSYLALGDHERARALLNEAAERNEQLRETVTLYLAIAEQAAGNPDEARQHWQTLVAGTEEIGPARVLRERLEAQAAPVMVPEPPVVRPWQLLISVSGGYNSNVIALGDDVPLPADISRRGGAFIRTELAASYDLFRDDRNRLTAGYGAQADIHTSSQHSDANLIYQLLHVTYSRHLRNDLVAGLAARNAFTVLGGRSFSNQIGAEPFLNYRVNSHLVLSGSYRFAYTDYFFPTIPVRDRDGDSHTLRAAVGFQLPGTELRGRAGYHHAWHNTDGSDFKRNTHGLFVALQHPLPRDITAQVNYTRLFTKYDNSNSFTGFTRARRDRVDLLSVRLARPVVPNLDVFVRYNLINHDVNIPVFDYTQHVTSAGLIYRF